jgi:hypothetical protein
MPQRSAGIGDNVIFVGKLREVGRGRREMGLGFEQTSKASRVELDDSPTHRIVANSSERDFKVVVAEDGISGLYEKGLDELKKIGVVVKTAEEIIAEFT